MNFPGHYLRVRSGGEIGVDQSDGTDAFRVSATFRRVTGLADPALSSYQTWSDPGRYLARQSTLVNAVTAPAAADATFAEVPPAPGY